jgi:hypothetical protein
MSKTVLIITSGITGLILGYFSANSFFASSWTALILWGAAGLVLGYLAKSRKETFIPGALYGFLITAAFLIFGFHGASDKFKSYLILVLIISVAGAICGLVLFFLGNLINTLTHKKASIPQ